MKLKKMNIWDIAIFQMIIILMAFKDYSMLANISRLMGFAGSCIGVIAKDRLRIKNSTARYVLLKTLFMCFCALSAIWSVNASVTVSWVESIFVRMMVGFAIITYVSTEERRDKILNFFLCAGIILCIRIIIAVPISGWGTVRIGKYLAHDKGTSYGNTGVTYVLSVISVYLLVFYNKLPNKVKYSLIACFSVFSFMSGSKKGVFILFIAVALFLLLKSNNLSKMIKNFFTFAVIAVTVLIVIMKNDLLYNVLGRRLISFVSYFMTDSNVGADLSTIGRANYVRLAFSTFISSPIIGVGIDGVRALNPQNCWAENNFAELLADVGLIGFSLYYWIPVSLVYPSVKRRKHRCDEDIAIIVLFSVLMFIDYTMVSYANSTLQVHLAFLYAVAMLNKKRVAICEG